MKEALRRPRFDLKNMDRRQFMQWSLLTGGSVYIAAWIGDQSSPDADPAVEGFGGPVENSPLPNHENQQNPEVAEAIAGGVAFLNDRFNPDVGLFQESPIAESTHYWLKTSNGIAAHALRQIGEDDLAAQVQTTVDSYEDPPHGVIEALHGEQISMPPRTSTRVTYDSPHGDATVLSENRTEGNEMSDWLQYADLALYGAWEAKARGDETEAATRYDAALAMFDGTGFADRPYLLDESDDGQRYDTYKLALALHTGQELGLTNPHEDSMRSLLVNMQGDDGGFITKYTAADNPVGDANVETAAHALLALSHY